MRDQNSFLRIYWLIVIYLIIRNSIICILIYALLENYLIKVWYHHVLNIFKFAIIKESIGNCIAFNNNWHYKIYRIYIFIWNSNIY